MNLLPVIKISGILGTTKALRSLQPKCTLPRDSDVIRTKPISVFTAFPCKYLPKYSLDAFNGLSGF